MQFFMYTLEQQGESPDFSDASTVLESNDFEEISAAFRAGTGHRRLLAWTHNEMTLAAQAGELARV